MTKVTYILLLDQKDLNVGSSVYNISIHSVNICHYAWFKKEADWSIAEQNKIKQKSQTEYAGKKRGVVREVDSRCKEKQNGVF